MNEDEYRLLDAGGGRKLERFGRYVLDRPCAQAVWRPARPASFWSRADGFFTRENGSRWRLGRDVPEEWTCRLDDLAFRIHPTDFGHVGVFPEHAAAWRMLRGLLPSSPAAGRPVRALNLFAYSGGATLAAARQGCQVCHLDASRKMVEWARRNAALNRLEDAPVRWIVDDVRKFLHREIRRARRYELVVLDPPSFGRGTNQELFQIDQNIPELLDLCRQVLADPPLGILLTCHTPGYTPVVLEHLLSQAMETPGSVQAGEMLLTAEPPALSVPSGAYALWQK